MPLKCFFLSFRDEPPLAPSTHENQNPISHEQDRPKSPKSAHHQLVSRGNKREAEGRARGEEGDSDANHHIDGPARHTRSPDRSTVLALAVEEECVVRLRTNETNVSAAANRTAIRIGILGRGWCDFRFG